MKRSGSNDQSQPRFKKKVSSWQAYMCYLWEAALWGMPIGYREFLWNILGKNIHPSVSGNNAPKKNHFYALRTRESKLNEDDDDGKFFYLFLYFYELLQSGGV